jgi:hypothetical protein
MTSRPITDPSQIPAASEGPPSMTAQISGPDLPLEIRQAHEAFCRDLGQLVEERPGEWVAYRGTSRIGFASSKTSLIQHCLSLGLKRGEFLVRSIELAPGDTLMGPGILEGSGLLGEGFGGGPAS